MGSKAGHQATPIVALGSKAGHQATPTVALADDGGKGDGATRRRHPRTHRTARTNR